VKLEHRKPQIRNPKSQIEPVHFTISDFGSEISDRPISNFPSLLQVDSPSILTPSPGHSFLDHLFKSNWSGEGTDSAFQLVAKQ
jgi:hypothetical protein